MHATWHRPYLGADGAAGLSYAWPGCAVPEDASTPTSKEAIRPAGGMMKLSESYL